MKGAHSLWERQVTGLPAHRRVVASLFSPRYSACGVIKTANMVCLQRVRQGHEFPHYATRLWQVFRMPNRDRQSRTAPGAFRCGKAGNSPACATCRIQSMVDLMS